MDTGKLSIYKLVKVSGIRSIYSKALIPLLLGTLIVALAGIACASDDKLETLRPVQHFSKPIVVAFQGGLFRVPTRYFDAKVTRLQREYGARGEIDFNGMGARSEAMRFIHNALDTDGNGTLSAAEKQNARIILVGHSWGAAALLRVAQDLQKEGIPVLLTVQIDSVPKPGFKVGRIPPNVKEAINFFQKTGWIRGRSEILADDPTHTTILGNIKVPYDRASAAACPDYKPLMRIFNKGHMAIQCNPRVWSRIEAVVASQLGAPTTALAQNAD